METNDASAANAGADRHLGALILGWIAVGGPLLWGVAQTIRRALALFR